MLDSLHRNFGLLIAFVLPGFVFLLGCIAIEDKQSLIEFPAQLTKLDQLGVFFSMLLASATSGIILSAVRWVVLDTVHHATGLTAPVLNQRSLVRKQGSFTLALESTYRYYLFFGNTLVGILLLGAASLSAQNTVAPLAIVRWTALCAILFLASRDALSRFYSRSRLIAGEAPAFRQR